MHNIAIYHWQTRMISESNTISRETAASVRLRESYLAKVKWAARQLYGNTCQIFLFSLRTVFSWANVLCAIVSVTFVCMACVIGIDVKKPTQQKKSCVNISYQKQERNETKKKEPIERVRVWEGESQAHTLQSAWSAKMFVWCFLLGLDVCA